ncbi:GBS Bsp-like repeat-containing protein [Streptococcus pseudoporcinus]|uniref:N-acetylmuramoyl-L-alanine amidase n=1 Tax=Streptococcus pseudoporcinus TaxID=361101 RepID=A0A4U9XM31_9STRE|nr:GBS Bsp-like repeat-containing protein [Streptococcus pseudoporcinus]VTS13688.1 N-acetylmuramoyl-L-alanine amidase [Streptococcus pseudoporcinus]VUC66739.1 N-acetylmuramoyl-L-alanine amidase [Streptococcus pseudoporcinus]VUC97668.1 N-acetylmuramoyl-L-alanine amidase [Streptococcus pseudoporcinus]VUC98059.1 N-acetylmuramoyl-L-alanine amidase [Streptococcus pseudoporcinus]
MVKKIPLLLIAPLILGAFWNQQTAKASEAEVADQKVSLNVVTVATKPIKTNVQSSVPPSSLTESTIISSSATTSKVAVTPKLVGVSVASTKMDSITSHLEEKARKLSEPTVETKSTLSVSDKGLDQTVSKQANVVNPPAPQEEQSDLQVMNDSRLSVSKASRVVQPVKAIVDDKGITIQYQATIPTNTSILYAVWGDQQGQNDLTWYQSSATGAAYVEFARHKEYGKYHIHTYSKSYGIMVGINTLEISLLRPQITSKVVQNNSNSFTITVSNVPSTITGVSIPVWTDKNGQDDLKWYQASQTSAGVYQVLVDIANHHNEKDLYNIHIYGNSTITGGQIGLATRTYSNVESKANAKIYVIDYAENKTQFTVNVVGSSSTKTLTDVQIAVWSEGNGQDDLAWYKPVISSNMASQIIDIAKHSNTSDNYIIHVYTNYSDGSREGLSLGAYKITKKRVDIKAPDVSVVNYQASKGKLDVLITQGTKTIKAIRVAAWSEADQSNMHWYVTSSLTNNQATVLVNQIYHKLLEGNYTIHTYLDFSDNTSRGFNLGQYYFAKPIGLSASQGNYAVVNNIIYLDAGHGGYDSGAAYFNQYEKTLNLQMQNRIKAKLEAAGYKVITTRTSDTYVDLIPRSENANASLSDLFVSLHFNASTSSYANGIESYYYEYYPEYPSAINELYHDDLERLSRSAFLAQAIQSAAVKNTGAKDNGVLRNTFAVLRETTAPAVLLELGYMSNATEFQKITTAAYQEKLANGVVSGILAYYKHYTV